MSLSGPDWVKLSQLLDEALDLDPAHRKQWVESLPPEHRGSVDTLRDLLLRESGTETSDSPAGRARAARRARLPQSPAAMSSGRIV